MPSHLMWRDVPDLWRQCFELAWQSYRAGSNPIGALVADAEGRVLSEGMSAVKAEVAGATTFRTEISHAEVNALLGLDNRVHTKELAQNYTLYTSLEPCPVCFSALYMSDVPRLLFAAKDRYGGSTNQLGTTPYLRRKRLEIGGPMPFLQDISIVLNVYYDVRRGCDDVVHDEFAKDYPNAVAAGRALAQDHSFQLDPETEFSTVYALLSDRLLGSAA